MTVKVNVTECTQGHPTGSLIASSSSRPQNTELASLSISIGLPYINSHNTQTQQHTSKRILLSHNRRQTYEYYVPFTLELLIQDKYRYIESWSIKWMVRNANTVPTLEAIPIMHRISYNLTQYKNILISKMLWKFD